MKRQHAFTLIELLVVVAIIAILAAIALPNFLEAQTRSKVARTKADMRSISTAVESYAVDWNRYPHDFYGAEGTDWNTWVQITTPVGYMTTFPFDPFHSSPTPYDYGYDRNRPTDAQKQGYNRVGVRYIFLSVGPNKEHEYDWSLSGETGYNLLEQIAWWSYDTTNGTVSPGDIIRTNRGVAN